ncbi:hypothetical protein MDIS_03440 [Mesomycoplasma dispar]|nr:hypothetical protein MDIS_03440 [Mesomycoplasma dispar]
MWIFLRRKSDFRKLLKLIFRFIFPRLLYFALSFTFLLKIKFFNNKKKKSYFFLFRINVIIISNLVKNLIKKDKNKSRVIFKLIIFYSQISKKSMNSYTFLKFEN